MFVGPSNWAPLFPAGDFVDDRLPEDVGDSGDATDHSQQGEGVNHAFAAHHPAALSSLSYLCTSFLLCTNRSDPTEKERGSESVKHPAAV